MSAPKKYTHHHKDGTVWATGEKTGVIMTGYWEWFRKDGTRMRSGSFNDAGEQTGEWTTYDKAGNVFKVSVLKPKSMKLAEEKQKKKQKKAAEKAKAKKAKARKKKTKKKSAI